MKGIWGVLGCVWGVLGRLCGDLGRLWGVLGRAWGAQRGPQIRCKSLPPICKSQALKKTSDLQIKGRDLQLICTLQITANQTSGKQRFIWKLPCKSLQITCKSRP